jgi:hypothetical protein
MKFTAWIRVILITVILLWGGNCRAETDWEVIDAANSPGARIGQGMTTLPDGRILLFGGEDDAQNIYNDLFAYDSKQWSPITSTNASPAARRNQETWYRDGKLYIHGGVAKDHEMLDDLWAFDVAKREWAQIQTGTTKPIAEYGRAAVPLPDGSVILTSGTLNGYAMKDAWKLNTDNTFTSLGTSPVEMDNPTAQRDGDVLYLFGKPGKVATFNTRTNQWAELTGGPPIAGGATSALGVNGAGQKIVYIIGGVDANGAESNVVYEYNTATGGLSQRQERMPSSQKWAAAATTNSSSLNVILFGGVSNGFYTNRTLKFSPGTTQPPAQLIVNKTGNGTVASTPSGIDCGLDCTESYVFGTSVTLTGTPADDSRFAGWSGGGCSQVPACSLQMTSDKTVTATFVQRTTPKGDVDQNTLINLADVILAMQILAGMSTTGKTVTLDADVNNNGRIDLSEVIYVLQKTGAAR